MSPFIFTISVNSAKVTAVMLCSFVKHHPNRQIFVVGTPDEFEKIEKYIESFIPNIRHSNVRYIDIEDNKELMQDFKQGHRGTTKIFAMVIKRMLLATCPEYPYNSILEEEDKEVANYTHFIHLDGDLYFKRESMSIIESAFIGSSVHGVTPTGIQHFETPKAQLVGTRRCYANNPSGVKGLEKYPDTISTYIFGMDIRSVPDYPFEKLCRYCEGAEHPLGWLVLDAFDGVTHAVMQNGGYVHMLDQNQFGSQNTEGKKTNNYQSNMHMDCGSHLIHFGGVGSGHAFYHGHSKPPEGYANWAVGRYALFCKLFYNEDIPCPTPTQYGPDGRWINGTYDENILETLKREMNQ